jgi:hypothetical protein
MVTIVWNNLANTKFKAIYTYECSRMADRYRRVTSAMLALTSTSSVAAWAIWQQHPAIWGAIIGISQVAQVLKPYVPFIGSDKEFLEMSFEFDQLYLEYEKLWYAASARSIDDAGLSQRISELHKKGLDIEKAHKNTRTPRRKQWVEKAYAETENFLKLNFS